MYATLRNTLVAALGLLLVTAPVRADGGSNAAEVAKLQAELDQVEAEMAAVSKAISETRGLLNEYRQGYAETGKPEYKALAEEAMAQITALQNDLAVLSSYANDLRVRIAWLQAQDRSDGDEG